MSGAGQQVSGGLKYFKASIMLVIVPSLIRQLCTTNLAKGVARGANDPDFRTLRDDVENIGKNYCDEKDVDQREDVASFGLSGG